MTKQSDAPASARGRHGAAGTTSGSRAIPAPKPTDGEFETEIRALRALQISLEAERDEYRELYENGPLAALTLDSACGIYRLNRAAATLLGGRPERLYQRNFRSFVCPESRLSLAQHLAQVSGRGSVQSTRIRLQLGASEVYPVELWTRFSPLWGRYEIRLMPLREQEQLEERARRLSESERLAREANTAKDKFIAVLSHELRTPLTPVLAAASAQRKRAHPDELRDVFQMIERNIAAEARLIDDLLDVSRIVRNKMLFERKPADVQAVALEAVEDLRPEANAKQQRIEISFSARRTVSDVDTVRLRQVFSNLLKNAVKFTPQAGHILLSSWNAEDSVVLEVQDNGVGIEPANMQRLFEPFVEERGQAPAGGLGLGLGLAICKGLVELQGGRISAHSRGKGRGSRFLVELPVIDAPAAVLVPRAPASSPRNAAALTPQLQRVLLVEDHQDTIEVLTALLVDKGFIVETASSLEAARQIDVEKVDVIVSDIALPDGTGLELMKELRTRVRRPAIALTGFGMESDMRASREAGFDLHLTKPVSIERLVEAIHSLTPEGP